MARQRDYKAEYARRIANAEARGLTRQQARGHGAGESKNSLISQINSLKQEAFGSSPVYSPVRALKSISHDPDTGKARTVKDLRIILRYMKLAVKDRQSWHQAIDAMEEDGYDYESAFYYK